MQAMVSSFVREVGSMKGVSISSSSKVYNPELPIFFKDIKCLYVSVDEITKEANMKHQKKCVPINSLINCGLYVKYLYSHNFLP